MDKVEFQNYCKKIKAMMANVPDWNVRPSSIIADYLKTSTAYGFGMAIVDLLKSGYDVIKDAEQTQTDADFELSELASALSFRYTAAKNYNFSAFYFVTSLLAVCLDITPIDAVEFDAFNENDLLDYNIDVFAEEDPDPVRAQLKRYGIRLLDFSRKNNLLVHFESSKSNGIKLHTANFNTTLKAILDNEKIYLSKWDKVGATTIVKCSKCNRYMLSKYDFAAKKQSSRLCEHCDAKGGNSAKSMQPIDEDLVVLKNDELVCGRCDTHIDYSKLSEYGFRCPQCHHVLKITSYPLVGESEVKRLPLNEVLSGASDANTIAIVKNLISKSGIFENNFGLHILYLACGFLKWMDKSGSTYSSPILLCPINLFVDKKNDAIYFETARDEFCFEVNKTLRFMLSAYSKDHRISMPKLDTANIRTYFSLLKESFRKENRNVARITNGWEIVLEFGIGLFQYQKIQLHDDLETNMEQYLQHPVIRRLCGDTDCELSTTAQRLNSLEYMSLDADSSQEEVIVASQQGKSFVLQGPPGSGKSQTITNIISVALGDGKSVLFVTEKASARSVIIDNMNRCYVDGTHSLTDFVLDFNGVAKNKRSGAVSCDSLVDEINKHLQVFNDLNGFNEQIIADEKYGKSRIDAFMRQAKEKHDGRCYLELLQDIAKYAKYPDLLVAKKIPQNSVVFSELCSDLEKYYTSVQTGKCTLDYTQDALCGCTGDATERLEKMVDAYVANADVLHVAVNELRALGWHVIDTAESVDYCVKLLSLWQKMPVVTAPILENLDIDKIDRLLGVANKRKQDAHSVEHHAGRSVEKNVNIDVFTAKDLSAMHKNCHRYHIIFHRLGTAYKAFLQDVADCFISYSGKKNYRSIKRAVEQLTAYQQYIALKNDYDEIRKNDYNIFGEEPVTEREWDDVITRLKYVRSILVQTDSHVIDMRNCSTWLPRFTRLTHDAQVYELEQLQQTLCRAVQTEKDIVAQLAPYFDTMRRQNEYPYYEGLARIVKSESYRLGEWKRINALLDLLEQKNWLDILDELIDKNMATFKDAKGALLRVHAMDIADDFVNKYKLSVIRSMHRDEHERLLLDYADKDKQMLKSGAMRLYSKLAEWRSEAADTQSISSTELPKIASKKDASVKQTILENWDYIRKIKPCFMMSPANVSEYLDIGVSFDLVIFDEASQVFIEDALAAISRGKQIIVAGDSKQLPPCDFFKAGDVSLDESGVYFGEESNSESSLLTALDAAMTESSIQLCWHYRSCDEALIAFSNEYMDYNLISFPSAIKNPNDGIKYINVPYDPKTCYVSGKVGKHINVGEADRIVELIWEEISHPERNGFTVGVVAFSNAQAQEIEKRWTKYRQDPSKKMYIDQWESEHEPIIFCNLDTMQGDERDTMILSICYSQDATGKFKIPYLGRIRLESGKKRINVAVTRARHQMIVVSTLTYDILKNTIDASSAPEENKGGARMLAAFLKYAESFSYANDVVALKSLNPFVYSVCEVLDEYNIGYETEVGRSECKINVAVKDPQSSQSFVLGIIIDDPRRTDFDSPREYARLTESVLENKYNWNIYRIYPQLWISDFKREKEMLLSTIKRCLLNNTIKLN